MQALGGAKNHMLVMPDADLDMTADAAVSAAYGSAGERCMAVSVVVAVGDVGDALVQKIADRMADLTIGDGTDPASEMGPLITQDAKDRVESYVAGAAAEGATVVVDGREAEFAGGGFFTGVSLIDHVQTDSKVYRDEIFGPGPRGCPRRQLRGWAAAHQRPPVRQRHRNLYPRRRRRAPVRVRG